MKRTKIKQNSEKKIKIENRLSVQKPVSRKNALPYIRFFLIVLIYIFEAKKGCKKKV